MSKKIDQNLPYRPEFNHNEHLRQKFPVCSICGSTLEPNQEVIGVIRDGEYYASLCLDECMKTWQQREAEE